MTCRIEYRHYQRKFVHPLRTTKGEWATREGFIVKVEEDGQTGYGEIAPIPAFGTETVGAAHNFLRQLITNPERTVPANLPCCAFGLRAANFGKQKVSGSFAVAALLPAGTQALEAATKKNELGYSTFKWKIGVDDIASEKAILQELINRLPQTARLRLDANAGLNLDELEAWLDTLVECTDQIEFLEQPLPVGEEALMAELAEVSTIPIALDESLNGLDATKWLEPNAWAGPLVIKPLLMGDIQALRKRLQPAASHVVYSSAFETGIGLANAFALIGALPASRYAIGFDTLSAFDDRLSLHESKPSLNGNDITALNLEQIWNRLAHSL